MIPNDLSFVRDIKQKINTGLIGRQIFHYDKVKSTNDVALDLFKKNIAFYGSVIIAEYQTCGRGRRGHRWFSPSSAGLWFSVLLEPSKDMQKDGLINAAFCLAIVEVLRKYGIKSGVKWPNDVYIRRGKVAGVMTEKFSVDSSNKSQDILVSGIGLNYDLSVCDIPEELKDKAAGLIDQGVKTKLPARIDLFANLLESLDEKYLCLTEKKYEDIMKKWKGSLIDTSGNDIKILVGARQIEGRSCGINEDGALVIEKKNGDIENVYSGTFVD